MSTLFDYNRHMSKTKAQYMVDDETLRAIAWLREHLRIESRSNVLRIAVTEYAKAEGWEGGRSTAPGIG
jgi:hypothetical protein